jgi:hypothetical protein
MGLMVTAPRFKMLLSSVLLPLSLLTLSACGAPNAEDVCDTYCDCEGCSDGEYDKCRVKGEKLEYDAEKLGCEDQLDDYFECLDDDTQCRNSDFEAEDSCKDLKKRLDNCGVDV